MPKALSQQVINIIEEFLGPAAERYVQRLISFHLNKEPEMLKISDLPQLTNWVKVSLGLMTDNKKLIDDCEKKLLALKHS